MNKFKEIMKKIFQIKNIPNMVTASRIPLSVLFVALFATGNIIPGIVTLGVTYLTDTVDGYLARKLNAESKFGKYLDPVTDKIVNISTIISVSILFNFAYILTLIPEVMIIAVTLKNENKKDSSTTLKEKFSNLFKNLDKKEDEVDNVKQIGRIKAWAIAINMISALLAVVNKNFSILFKITLPISITTQLLTLREYYNNNSESKIEKVASTITKPFTKNNEENEKTIQKTNSLEIKEELSEAEIVFEDYMSRREELIETIKAKRNLIEKRNIIYNQDPLSLDNPHVLFDLTEQTEKVKKLGKN